MHRNKTLSPLLSETIKRLLSQINNIPEERKTLLRELASYIKEKLERKKPVRLIFICTHNSRRSHISQIWAHTAAWYFGLENISSFSGGTEATAFNPRAVQAMKNAGFVITKKSGEENPVYQVAVAEGEPALEVFSKSFDDVVNPHDDFAAVMTCSEADQNCPIIPGAEIRLPLRYNDPKEFDGTPLEEEKYKERVMQIGRELLYAFSLVEVR